MRIQKRLLAAFLAASMVFSLSTAAFADDDNSAVTSTDNKATANETSENKANITVNGTYLSELESDTIISVNVAWTDMNFEYAASQQGTWDPTDHTYGGASDEGKWLKDSATITVTNHSNEKITANLKYDQIDTGVIGTLDQTELNLDNAAVGDSLKNPDSAPSEEVGFKVSGAMNSKSTDLGTITVTIEKNLILDLTEVTKENYATTIEKFATKNGVTKLRMKLGTAVVTYSHGSKIYQGCMNAGVTDITILDVETVQSSAFSGCSGLTAISMPKVTEIYASAFRDCTNLQKIDFPKVENIYGTYVFDSCTALQEVNLPELQSLSGYSFWNCTGITSVNLPKLTEMNGGSSSRCAFYGCTALRNVSLPNLTNTGSGMFCGCTALESITLPNVENLAETLFRGCTDLKEVSVPKATSVALYAFLECSSLEKITFESVLSDVNSSAFGSNDDVDYTKVTLTLNAAQTDVNDKGFSWDGNTFNGTTFKSIEKAS